jgi:hypothetical protein
MSRTPHAGCLNNLFLCADCWISLVSLYGELIIYQIKSNQITWKSAGYSCLTALRSFEKSNQIKSKQMRARAKTAREILLSHSANTWFDRRRSPKGADPIIDKESPPRVVSVGGGAVWTGGAKKDIRDDGEKVTTKSLAVVP